MSQNILPPTPAPSTDIKGRENGALQSADSNFNLPPSAMSRGSSSSSQLDRNDGSNAPISPENSVESQHSADDVRKRSDLPPPPGRSRKIIQVKPKTSTKEEATPDVKSRVGKKKQGNSTSAGRKIARKTAHSLIERRRRSKMNEEFGTLKDLIPACEGQEMHKLAILQASIDYLRYLESCLSDLHARHGTSHSPYPASRVLSQSASAPHSESEPDSNSDDEMQDLAPAPEPTYHPASLSIISPSASAFTSPAFSASSSTTGPPHMHLPSPILSARDARYAPYAAPTITSPSHSTQTSPMLFPQRQASELDHEASAALLMLNKVDRRSAGSFGRERPRGMSVKDLLSD